MAMKVKDIDKKVKDAVALKIDLKTLQQMYDVIDVFGLWNEISLETRKILYKHRFITNEDQFDLVW